MFNNSERKEARLISFEGNIISAPKYNFIMGTCLLYGFVLNAILVDVAAPLMANVNPMLFLIGYFICAIAGAAISAKSANPFISFIGYNLICLPIGLLLSIFLPLYGTTVILRALLATCLVTVFMIVLSMILPGLFLKLGKALFVALLAVIVVELLFALLGLPIDWIDFVAVGIFSLYIGYDFCMAQRYPKTIDNAVDSAIDLYLDIINLFIRLVEIFGRSRD